MHKPLFSAIALTLFPDMFPGPLGLSLAGKALEKGIWSLSAIDIRNFATDKHRTVDDSPYGGGTGMVMKPDVVDSAIEHAKTLLPGAKIIYTSPRGVPLTQPLVNQLKDQNLIIVVVGHGERCIGAADFAAEDAQAFKRLRAGDFVDQVAVDIHQARAVVLFVDQMRFPDFIVECFCCHRGPIPGQGLDLFWSYPGLETYSSLLVAATTSSFSVMRAALPVRPRI